jgi:hypothetical protein
LALGGNVAGAVPRGTVVVVGHGVVVDVVVVVPGPRVVDGPVGATVVGGMGGITAPGRQASVVDVVGAGGRDVVGAA